MIDELDNRVRNMEYINSQEFICDLLRTVDYSKMKSMKIKELCMLNI